MKELKLTFYLIGGTTINATDATNKTRCDYATELANTDRRIFNDNKNGKTTVINMQNVVAVEIAEV